MRRTSFLLVFCMVLGLLALGSVSYAQDSTPNPEQDPAEVTRLWLTAVLDGNGIDIARYTCRNLRSQLQQSLTLVTLFSSFDSIGTGFGIGLNLSMQADLRDLSFVAIESNATTARVRISGELIIAVGANFEAQDVDATTALIYENERWKVCDGGRTLTPVPIPTQTPAPQATATTLPMFDPSGNNDRGRIDLGQSLTNNVDTFDDDYYSLLINTQKQVTVNVVAQDDNLDPQLYVYNVNRQWVGENDDISTSDNNFNSRLTLNLAPGTYYLVVSAWGSGGRYEISVSR